MKNEILNIIIELGTKHFSRRVKNTPHLWRWVLSNTPELEDSISLSERIYVAISGENSICKFEEQKKFKSFDEGYGFCGPTGKCECARQSVSQKVSEAKQAYTDEENEKINEKRRQTVLEEYGVDYVVQTDKAKKAHQEFYENEDSVRMAIEKHRNSFQTKYGPYITNYAQTDEHNKRMTTNNPMKNLETIDKALETKKDRYDENYYKLKSIKRIKELLFEENIEIIVEDIDYIGVNHNYDFKCLVCGYSWNQILWRTVGVKCKVCNPTIYTYKSKEENEVKEYLQSLGITIIQRNQSLIGQQLDLICPDYKIAIEYCGLYYHSELSKPNASSRNKKYHLNKLERTEDKDWRLITIFSDEWKNKNEIVKNFLKYVFQKTKERIYARKTKIQEIDWKTTKDFLNIYHLQGASQGTFCNLGLFYEDKLVALMTFSELRISLNSTKEEDCYELVRFVTSGSSIVGGASKLLSYFVKKYDPKRIVSYADRRWSTGNLYKTLNFSYIHNSPPSYWYTIDYEKRFHRFNFRKKKLIEMGFDETKTEWEIMRYDLGYDRIWDCGVMKFEWSKEKIDE